jgi:hypothetical protein
MALPVGITTASACLVVQVSNMKIYHCGCIMLSKPVSTTIDTVILHIDTSAPPQYLLQTSWILTVV